ncbi:helix-turn-helix domain-containing protein [Candidatus Mycoplasma mahonii]|uniref:helix-turn-helix domain-containing protein n=1 Tax=Candidatus Mycoplasma mahonii TaxID=3004105 RepID=UPI0026F28CEF|nr:helix-turn-helix transcriptional regulator [Candidatus Mycoplasma mahonii]WKX02287.1 helix-turn-helix transcriptional regulator [Candidatus Mycoplasma mahonii]
MIIEILKDSMTYENISQKDLSISTGLSPQLISELLSGKRELQLKPSRKIEMALNLPAFSLLKAKISHDEFIKRSSDQEMKVIANFLESQRSMALFSKETLINKASEWLGANKVSDKKSEFLKTIVGFKKYKDKPLAYFWLSLLEKKYGNLISVGKFKKSSGPSVLKGILDILINSKDIDDRLKELESFLNNNGIILINAPFIPDSTIHGACFKRKNQRFIFMSDMKKREYSYIFTLVHELCHYYFNFNHSNKNEDDMTANKIREYLKKYNKNHKELELAMTVYEEKNVNNNEKWDRLHDNTSLKINFGKINNLLENSQK